MIEASIYGLAAAAYVVAVVLVLRLFNNDSRTDDRNEGGDE